jgi:hypothetical protein
MNEIHEITYMRKDIKYDEEKDKYFETYTWDRKSFEIKSEC